MKRLVRELRILPVLMLAAGCLLALKVFGIALDGGYILSDADQGAAGTAAPKIEPVSAKPDSPKQSWAQEVFNFQNGDRQQAGPKLAASDTVAQDIASPDTTGSVPESKPAEKKTDPPDPVNPPKSGLDGKLVPLNAPPQPSSGERAVLERLQERRQELDARAREIDIRETLLKAAEKRIEARAQELKETEARIAASGQKKDAQNAQRFKGLVTMYENMKAKDAAKVFDRLEMKILFEIASQINPRRMADILAQMQPETAERLTVELASRANGDKSPSAGDLPKIEGKPNGS
jgi:flagellar motility protein MotE (MotC chaperone)